MRIVFASTEEQEQYIEELIEYMYEDIFPQYFSDETIDQLDDLAVLKPHAEKLKYNGTLREAFQIISSLQALTALLNHLDEHSEAEQRELYNRNIKILKQYGYQFPLTFDNFLSSKEKEEQVSKYGKPANKWIV
ncbi:MULTISPECIES: DUF5365 family protein [Bacillaceae]|uniref:DUF5365 family protein n=1 Tax=Bacillaceae TaxID=186817 RepID=UPI000C75EE1E|nr:MULTISPECIES: DUF5365 family protein [Bacillaceae]PLR67598.1 hypothetical protein CYJ36_13185 [Bacillus sp. UMB0893]QNG59893.1 DUF5365 family protein [Bacillus sp. PAMC26568]